MKRTRSEITSDLYILNWKSSYDVTLSMFQSRSTIFPGILFFVIFRPRDMQEYIFMFSIALEWTVYSICDHQISNWCREIFKYNTVISLIGRQRQIHSRKYLGQPYCLQTSAFGVGLWHFVRPVNYRFDRSR